MSDYPSNLPPAAPQPKIDGLATTSMVLGIIGLVTVCLAFVLGLPAIICGAISLNRISKSNGTLGGRGRAMTGLITGIICMVIIPIVAILAAMLLPALQMARMTAQATACSSNIKQIELGCMQYADNHNDQLPPNLKALEQVGVNGNMLVCPAARNDKSGIPADYVYYGSGLKTSDLGSQTILITDSAKRHGPYFNIGFGDGHVERIRMQPGETLQSLIQKNGWKVLAPPAK